ncbi:hypothetical protein BC831DRAFT_475874 [Entophlyctis helioformis]|nr:hypothetical protein BC831DRAFT_475874 [Entophlyctis helioformis]
MLPLLLLLGRQRRRPAQRLLSMLLPRSNVADSQPSLNCIQRPKLHAPSRSLSSSLSSNPNRGPTSRQPQHAISGMNATTTPKPATALSTFTALRQCLASLDNDQLRVVASSPSFSNDQRRAAMAALAANLMADSPQNLADCLALCAPDESLKRFGIAASVRVVESLMLAVCRLDAFNDMQSAGQLPRLAHLASKLDGGWYRRPIDAKAWSDLIVLFDRHGHHRGIDQVWQTLVATRSGSLDQISADASVALLKSRLRKLPKPTSRPPAINDRPSPASLDPAARAGAQAYQPTTENLLRASTADDMNVRDVQNAIVRFVQADMFLEAILAIRIHAGFREGWRDIVPADAHAKLDRIMGQHQLTRSACKQVQDAATPDGDIADALAVLRLARRLLDAGLQDAASLVLRSLATTADSDALAQALKLEPQLPEPLAGIVQGAHVQPAPGSGPLHDSLPAAAPITTPASVTSTTPTSPAVPTATDALEIFYYGTSLANCKTTQDAQAACYHVTHRHADVPYAVFETIAAHFARLQAVHLVEDLVRWRMRSYQDVGILTELCIADGFIESGAAARFVDQVLKRLPLLDRPAVWGSPARSESTSSSSSSSSLSRTADPAAVLESKLEQAVADGRATAGHVYFGLMHKYGIPIRRDLGLLSATLLAAKTNDAGFEPMIVKKMDILNAQPSQTMPSPAYLLAPLHTVADTKRTPDRGQSQTSRMSLLVLLARSLIMHGYLGHAHSILFDPATIIAASELARKPNAVHRGQSADKLVSFWRETTMKLLSTYNRDPASPESCAFGDRIMGDLAAVASDHATLISNALVTSMISMCHKNKILGCMPFLWSVVKQQTMVPANAWLVGGLFSGCQTSEQAKELFEDLWSYIMAVPDAALVAYAKTHAQKHRHHQQRHRPQSLSKPVDTHAADSEIAKQQRDAVIETLRYALSTAAAQQSDNASANRAALQSFRTALAGTELRRLQAAIKSVDTERVVRIMQRLKILGLDKAQITRVVGSNVNKVIPSTPSAARLLVELPGIEYRMQTLSMILKALLLHKDPRIGFRDACAEVERAKAIPNFELTTWAYFPLLRHAGRVLGDAQALERVWADMLSCGVQPTSLVYTMYMLCQDETGEPDWARCKRVFDEAVSSGVKLEPLFVYVFMDTASMRGDVQAIEHCVSVLRDRGIVHPATLFKARIKSLVVLGDLRGAVQAYQEMLSTPIARLVGPTRTVLDIDRRQDTVASAKPTLNKIEAEDEEENLVSQVLSAVLFMITTHALAKDKESALARFAEFSEWRAASRHVIDARLQAAIPGKQESGLDELDPSMAPRQHTVPGYLASIHVALLRAYASTGDAEGAVACLNTHYSFDGTRTAPTDAELSFVVRAHMAAGDVAGVWQWYTIARDYLPGPSPALSAAMLEWLCQTSRPSVSSDGTTTGFESAIQFFDEVKAVSPRVWIHSETVDRIVYVTGITHGPRHAREWFDRLYASHMDTTGKPLGYESWKALLVAIQGAAEKHSDLGRRQGGDSQGALAAEPSAVDARLDPYSILQEMRSHGVPITRLVLASAMDYYAILGDPATCETIIQDAIQAGMAIDVSLMAVLLKAYNLGKDFDGATRVWRSCVDQDWRGRPRLPATAMPVMFVPALAATYLDAIGFHSSDRRILDDAWHTVLSRRDLVPVVTGGILCSYAEALCRMGYHDEAFDMLLNVEHLKRTDGGLIHAVVDSKLLLTVLPPVWRNEHQLCMAHRARLARLIGDVQKASTAAEDRQRMADLVAIVSSLLDDDGINAR